MKKKIILLCKNCNNRNYKTNKSMFEKRLQISKFCKNCKSHQIHSEEK